MMEGSKNNVTIKGWKEKFAEIIAERLEMSLMAKDIISDENGVDDRIMPKSLEKNSPLLLVNVYEELIVILPYEEYKQLENGEVAPIDYIEDSYWCYGRYNGELGVNISDIHIVFVGEENSMIEAIFWQPIDKKRGIHQTGKLKEYFASATYKMQKAFSNSGLYFERIHNGEIAEEAFKENEKKAEDLQEKDYRVFLYNAMKEDIEKDFGLEVTGLYCHNGGNPCLIADPDTPNKVKLYISAQLHNYILYHPIFRNWKQYAKSFRFELGTTVNDERVPITDGIEDKPAFCRQTLERLFTIKPIQEDEVSTEPEEPEEVEEVKEEVPTVEETNEVSKPKGVLGRIFNSFFKK